MLERILPARIDNMLRGHPLTLWLFAPVMIVKTGIALGMILNGREAARSADGIPLDTYGAAGTLDQSRARHPHDHRPGLSLWNRAEARA